MKKITIIIPTRNRLEHLKKTLDSIPKNDSIEIIIVCDGDKETFQYFLDFPNKNIVPIYMVENSGSVFCRNLCTSVASDGVLCAMDSVVFNSGAIEKALEIFNTAFSDDDGVYCFNFAGRGSCTALPLVGQKFLSRYDGKRLYYPSYFHFACQEISSLCFFLEKKNYKKYILHDTEILATKIIIKDETYRDARKYKEADHKFIKIRENANDIWGYNK